MAEIDTADMLDVMIAFLRDTQDSVALVDDDGNFQAFLAGTRYVGRKPEQVIGRNIADLVGPEVAQRIVVGLKAARVDGPAFEFEHTLTPTSSPSARALRIKVVRRKDGALLGHIRDVTDAVRAEAVARESHERFRLLARATTDAIFDWDAGTDQATWNDKITTRFGYPSNMRTSFQWWIDHIHPDDRDAVRDTAWRALQAPGEDLWEAELRFLHADGTYRHVLDRCIFLRDASGRGVRVIGAMLDITDRKRMTAKLERGERIVAAATLAASVGHELRGPLNYVLGNVALATSALEGGDAARALELLRSVPLGSERLHTIVDELAALARDAGSRSVIDVEQVVRASITMLDARLQERAVISVVAGSAAFVVGNAVQLGQMLTNILTNALQAIAERGDAQPRAPGSEPLEAGAVVLTLSSTEDHVVIRVDDNGRGLTQDEAQQAFDPLFTTRQGRGGSGLGLAVAHAVVNFHHGHIDVAPRTPRGTTFTITLPRAPASATDAAVQGTAAPSSAAIGSSQKRVLVVDDDELTLRLVESILSAHHVTRVQSGAEALAVLAKREFDIVLSDVAMPVLGGFELRDAIRLLGRPIRFGFLSGDDLGDNAGSPALRKPFSPEALRRFVSEL